MQGMERARIDCMTYEPDREDECCGASGRKMRRVCIRCQNYDRWRQRKEQEKEGAKHEKDY